MQEIRTSGSMSGDGKRSVAGMAQATAPILDSTTASIRCGAKVRTRSFSRLAARRIATAADGFLLA